MDSDNKFFRAGAGAVAGAMFAVSVGSNEKVLRMVQGRSKGVQAIVAVANASSTLSSMTFRSQMSGAKYEAPVTPTKAPVIWPDKQT